jgi:thymidylate synthase (FAD)
MDEDRGSVRVVFEPRVRLVGRQAVDREALRAFLADADAEGWGTDAGAAGEVLAEVAGRVCYRSFAAPRPGGHAAYIGHVLEAGHGNLFEHVVFSFVISGVSRSLTHELIRHRAGFSYSQRSQRFVDESAAAFVEPGPIAADPELHRIWLESIRASHAAYRELAGRLAGKFAHLGDRTLRRKKAREAARSVLPNATETEIFVTANARALRTFIEQRGTPEADAEIRRLAVALAAILKPEAPDIFGDVSVVGEGEDAAVVVAHRRV